MPLDITERFDTRDTGVITDLVNNLVDGRLKNDRTINNARKGMMGNGLLKSLAMNEPGAEKRAEKVFDWFRAVISGQDHLLHKFSEQYQTEAKSLMDSGALTPWEYKTLAPAIEGTNSSGGYTVPIEWAADITRNLGKYGFARRYFRTYQMARQKLDMAGLLTKPSVAVVAEAAAIPTSKPVLDQLVLTAKKVAGLYAASNELLEDANIDTYSIILDIFTEQFGITEDTGAFANDNTNWNGLLWYGAGTITSGIAANGARAISRKNNSAGGATTYPQFGEAMAAAGTDNWGDLLLMQTGQPSALFQGGKYFIDQNVLIALLSARNTQGSFGVSYDDLLNWGTGLEGQPILTFGGYEIVPLPTGIMFTYDASAHVSTPFTAFCNPQKSYCMIGLRGGFFVDTLREATLDSISLGQNDLTGIRMKERIAFGVGRPETVTILRTDAS